MVLTKVTETGLGNRLGSSFGGIIFGLILAVVAGGVLWWNEKRTVERYEDLEFVAKSVVSVQSGEVVAGNEGKLVHMTAQTATSGPVEDAAFGVSHDAIKIVRKAEMYQWEERVETRKEKNGTKEKTIEEFHYDKKWLSHLEDSSQFEDRSGHENPSTMKYQSETFVADEVSLDAFQLPDFLIGKIQKSSPLSIQSLEGASDEVKAEGKVQGNQVYFGANPGSPEIGDIRVSFAAVENGTVSVVAQQSGSSFVPFQSKNNTVDLLAEKASTAEEMFQAAEEQNKMMSWLFRVGGFVVMGIGFSMLFRPLVVLTNLIPFVGGLVEKGVGLIAFLMAGVISSLIVAVSWIFHRPILGVSILAVTVVCIVLVVRAVRSGKEQVAA